MTLTDVRQLVIDRTPFQVVHSKSGEDITRNVLLQIISEMEEQGHESLLTNRVLQELIRFYGDKLVGVMAPFLEQQILQSLAIQDRLRGKFLKAFSKPYLSPEQALRQILEQYRSILGQDPAKSDKQDKPV